jgi:tRNA-2-methylthio-N6-dimethylallyladenosine synthase
MRRSYRSEKFLGILERVRARIPNAAISTDIIVGFPGETDSDFEDTLRVVREARFASAFTFQYSIRPGTPAATLPNQIPKRVVQERYERLTALQDEISWEENKKLIGTEVRVLVGAEGTKDAATHRLSGRAEDSRLVHFDARGLGAELSGGPRPGDIVTVTISDAKPFYLIADAPDDVPLKVRRTRAGDAWDRADAESCAVPSHGSTAADGAAKVSLGLPTLRVSTTPIYDADDNPR